jgi:hypothetical protein
MNFVGLTHNVTLGDGSLKGKMIECDSNVMVGQKQVKLGNIELRKVYVEQWNDNSYLNHGFGGSSCTSRIKLKAICTCIIWCVFCLTDNKM